MPGGPPGPRENAEKVPERACCVGPSPWWRRVCSGCEQELPFVRMPLNRTCDNHTCMHQSAFKVFRQTNPAPEQSPATRPLPRPSRLPPARVGSATTRSHLACCVRSPGPQLPPPRALSPGSAAVWPWVFLPRGWAGQQARSPRVPQVRLTQSHCGSSKGQTEHGPLARTAPSRKRAGGLGGSLRPRGGGPGWVPPRGAAGRRASWSLRTQP